MEPQQYQELLDLLDGDPQRLHDLRVRLLTPDLITLPEQFAQMVATVNELGTQFHNFAETADRRLTSLEDNAIQTNRHLASLDAGVANLDVRVANLDANVANLDVRVSNLDARVSNLDANVANLDARVSNLDANVANLDARVSNLDANVANLTGSDLERRVRNNIRNIARDYLSLTRSQIVLAQDRDTNPHFLALINTAEENGRITRQQADRVLEADIIIRARLTSEDHYVHAVFEISRTIRNDDIQRTHDRAATVATATGEPSISAVIGQIIQPRQRQQAADLGVRVVTPVMFQQQTR